MRLTSIFNPSLAFFQINFFLLRPIKDKELQYACLFRSWGEHADQAHSSSLNKLFLKYDPNCTDDNWSEAFSGMCNWCIYQGYSSWQTHLPGASYNQSWAFYKSREKHACQNQWATPGSIWFQEKVSIHLVANRSDIPFWHCLLEWVLAIGLHTIPFG